jgi:iron complex transport system substrate-binding protein
VLQRKSFAVALLCAIFIGCSDSTPPPSSQPATSQAAAGTIVSLSPAATDLLLAMGAADRLAGVSTYDNDPRIAALPRVGDYENVDWERIAALAPRGMIMQMSPDRVPAGLRDRATKLGVRLHLSHIDRLDDILREASELGMFIDRKSDGDALRQSIERRLDALKQRTAGRSRVRTLICVNDDGLGVAGRNTYLDDLLVAAGGENALDASRGAYVHLDREALLALSPDAIIQLVPSPTAAQREAIKATSAKLGDLPAVKEGRVLLVDDPWALMPGAHVGELAERMAEFLHP